MILSEIQAELSALKAKNLLRIPTEVTREDARTLGVGRKRLLNFSSNNYLGFAHDVRVKRAAAAAVRRFGAGSGSSRLVSGNLEIHRALEKRLAAFKREEAALVFSSGYLANLGAVTALAGDKDVVFVDRLNHASLVDAARLSRATLRVYPHRDADTLAGLLSKAKAYRRRLVLTDAYFSMDGDVAPLHRLLEVCREQDALLVVDEAHSTGVFGAKGRGLVERFGLEGKIDVVMGTLSKALGSVGGFLAGSRLMRELFINRSKTFIYTTAPAPAASAAALAALEILEKSSAPREALWKNIVFVRSGLEAMGFDLMCSEGPILPVRAKNTKKALDAKRKLETHGIFAPAIRPPTVPVGTDRLRLSISAAHTQSDLEHLLSAMKKVRGYFR